MKNDHSHNMFNKSPYKKIWAKDYVVGKDQLIYQIGYIMMVLKLRLDKKIKKKNRHLLGAVVACHPLGYQALDRA